MAEIYNTKSNTLLSGTSGKDYILNGGWWNDSSHNGGSNVTINTGAGNDYVYNKSISKVTINTGEGNDSIENHGSEVTITGGKDNDTLSGGKGNDSLWGDAGKDTFIYASGDGKDVIYGFDNTDMLKITGTFAGTYNKSKKEIYFKVGSTYNAITLKDFG